MERTAREMAEYLGAELEGNPEVRITGCASVGGAKAGDLAFVDSPKQLEAAAKSAAGCIVLAPEMQMTGEDGAACEESAAGVCASDWRG